MDAFYRETWAEINLDNIFCNVSTIKETLPPTKQLIAVVKANAYGHGDVQVARTALEAGASMLAVATLDEAISLRKRDIKAPIIILGAVSPQFVYLAIKYNIILTVYSSEWLRTAQKVVPGTEAVQFHLKLDTGMGRLGLRTEEEIEEFFTILQETSRFKLSGVFTHFATADELDQGYYEQQYHCFQKLIRYIKEKGIVPGLVHCANSASLLRFPNDEFDAVRLGISMYGLTPSTEMKSLIPVQLKPAYSLHTKIVHVKKVEKGTSVSYGATYTSEQEEWIATLPIGYADGWMRRMQNFYVLVDGQKSPIVGRVCMDQCMIKIPYELPIGTQVTLIGKQGEEEITMEQVADHSNTINYEIPCVITNRMPKVFIQNGKQVEVYNGLSHLE
ncbi:alanine racemase [Priestia koreensis]|uniref:alanine racemase n=1 Tax=Priestia koreensis TaxID=284581 RepID=UPI0028F73BCC|nr:alanine racemase [Priestia koreensis]